MFLSVVKLVLSGSVTLTYLINSIDYFEVALLSQRLRQRFFSLVANGILRSVQVSLVVDLGGNIPFRSPKDEQVDQQIDAACQKIGKILTLFTEIS